MMEEPQDNTDDNDLVDKEHDNGTPNDDDVKGTDPKPELEKEVEPGLDLSTPEKVIEALIANKTKGDDGYTLQVSDEVLGAAHKVLGH